MDLLAFIGGAGRWLLRALLVIAPLLAWQWTITLGQPYRAKTGAIGPTLVASTMVGLGALVALLPGTTLTWDAIVTSGGFWDLTVPESGGVGRHRPPGPSRVAGDATVR